MKPLTKAISIGFSNAAIAGSWGRSTANSTKLNAKMASHTLSSTRRSLNHSDMCATVPSRQDQPQVAIAMRMSATTSVPRVNGTGVSMHTNQANQASVSTPAALAAPQPRSSSGASARATAGQTASAATWTSTYQVRASRMVSSQSSADTVAGPTPPRERLPLSTSLKVSPPVQSAISPTTTSEPYEKAWVISATPSAVAGSTPNVVRAKVAAA